MWPVSFRGLTSDPKPHSQQVGEQRSEPLPTSCPPPLPAIQHLPGRLCPRPQPWGPGAASSFLPQRRGYVSCSANYVENWKKLHEPRWEMRSGLKVIRAVAVWLLSQPPLRRWPLLEAASKAPSPPRAKAPREAGVAASLQWSARPLKIQSWVDQLPPPAASLSPSPLFSVTPQQLPKDALPLGDAEAPLGVGRKEVRAENVSERGKGRCVCTQVCALRPAPPAVLTF